MVELLLKAIIARRFTAETIPSLGLVRQVYTHDLEMLALLADLTDAVAARGKRDPTFKANWEFVVRWSLAARYRNNDADIASRCFHARMGTPDTERLMTWLKQQT